MPARRRRDGNPFRGVIDTVSEMNRIADRMTGSSDTTATQQPRGHTDAWAPPTDILNEDGDLLIRCDLPGVGNEDVEVSLSRGTLTIAGERRPGKASPDDYFVQERAHGQFRRDITLPEGVRDADIEAEFAEGVLLVTVKGSAAAPGPKQIEVRDRGAD